MNSDDILAQIDTALGDSSVSLDAMRSRPEAEPQVWIAPAGTDVDGDEWQRIEGISNIEFNEEPVEGADRFIVQCTAQQLEVRVSMSDDEIAQFQAFVEAQAACRRAAEAIAVSLQQLRDGFQGGDCADIGGDPVEASQRPRPPLPHRDGRPAWQSNYGPARRRR